MARTVAVLLAVLFLGSGCALPVSVSRVDQRTVYRRACQQCPDPEPAPARPRNTLRRQDLLARFDTDPAGAIAALQARVATDQDGSAALFALAEMSYCTPGRPASNPITWRPRCTRWRSCSRAPISARPTRLIQEFRDACDLYNLSLSSALKSADGAVVLRSGRYILRLVRWT